MCASQGAVLVLLRSKGREPFSPDWWVGVPRAGRNLIFTYCLTASHVAPCYMQHSLFHSISQTVTLERPSKRQRPWLLAQNIIRLGCLSNI